MALAAAATRPWPDHDAAITALRNAVADASRPTAGVKKDVLWIYYGLLLEARCRTLVSTTRKALFGDEWPVTWVKAKQWILDHSVPHDAAEATVAKAAPKFRETFQRAASLVTFTVNTIVVEAPDRSDGIRRAFTDTSPITRLMQSVDQVAQMTAWSREYALHHILFGGSPVSMPTVTNVQGDMLALDVRFWPWHLKQMPPALRNTLFSGIDAKKRARLSDLLSSLTLDAQLLLLMAFVGSPPTSSRQGHYSGQMAYWARLAIDWTSAYRSKTSAMALRMRWDRMPESLRATVAEMRS